VAQNANAPTPIRDSLHDPPGRDPPAKLVTRVRSSLHTLVPLAFVATLAWQSYGRAAREVIARWLAPRPVAQAAPASFAGASSDDLLAMSRSLAALRAGVDKLAADITKLQATKQGTPDGAAHLPSAADVPVQKPVPPTPPRAPPMR
jgi:hypothetical protein